MWSVAHSFMGVHLSKLSCMKMEIHSVFVLVLISTGTSLDYSKKGRVCK